MQLLSAQFILSYAAFILTVAATDNRREYKQYAQGPVGGPHGDDFSDKDHTAAGDHKRIGYINLFGCGAGEHLNAIETGFRDNHLPGWQAAVTTIHGSKSGKPASLIFAKDEFINEVDIWTYQAHTGWLSSKPRTRIGSLKMTTNKGNSISCGSKDNRDQSFLYSQKDGALLYFSGRAGNAVDTLQVNWIPKDDF